MSLKKYKAMFGTQEIPDELVKLWEFQEEAGFENYSNGFGLCPYDKTGLKTYSTDKKFLESLVDFAQANGTGSSYAIWVAKPGKSLNEQPIVVFGDEGGTHVVAENLRELLRLITFDAEPMIDHDEVIFYKDKNDYEEADGLSDYVKWLKTNFKLSPVKNPDEVVEKAQKAYKKAYLKWLSNTLKTWMKTKTTKTRLKTRTKK